MRLVELSAEASPPLEEPDAVHYLRKDDGVKPVNGSTTAISVSVAEKAGAHAVGLIAGVGRCASQTPLSTSAKARA